MINWNLIKLILKPIPLPFPDVVKDKYEELKDEGLTMGTLFIGRPGSGKTSSLAVHSLNYFVSHPDRAMFILDWSGDVSNKILKMVLQHEDWERLIKRIVYDEMGNPDIIVPLPEFSTLYGNFEDQVQRVSNNLIKLAPELVKNAPYLAGLGLIEILPQITRLITSIENEFQDTWQITEVRRLLTDKNLLIKTLEHFGDRNLSSKEFLQNHYLNYSASEKDMRTYAIVGLLGAVEPKEARARTGYYKPGWTPKEAIEKGLMVLIDGSRLINQKNTQHYLFTQAYSIIMAEINKRIPADPANKPVSIVMDEVYSLLSIPGMAEEVGMLSPLYRSRKLELYIVLQSLSQLAPTLRQQIWSLGNIVSFAVTNMNEAYEIAQQIFRYEAQTIKLPAASDTSNPIMEPDRGQYLEIANKVQRMAHRECLMRRYLSEKALDPNVRYIPKTKDMPDNTMQMTVGELKGLLLKERGVSVREALEVINRRTYGNGKPPQI